MTWTGGPCRTWRRTSSCSGSETKAFNRNGPPGTRSVILTAALVYSKLAQLLEACERSQARHLEATGDRRAQSGSFDVHVPGWICRRSERGARLDLPEYGRGATGLDHG